ncbi:DUF397 domain-containing protein [Streptomyces sp. NPDC127068]|uniref:DUF397 domain-containing protein n=1 Tax=Streptomyces sp. NPDC127068 TaxID=3347127 RepID=UPI00365A6855
MDSRWVKSSYSTDQANCVEVRTQNDGVAFRDSKRGESAPIVAVAARSWSAFVANLSDTNQT